MDNNYNPYSGQGYQRSAYPTYDQNYGTTASYSYQGYGQPQSYLDTKFMLVQQNSYVNLIICRKLNFTMMESSQPSGTSRENYPQSGWAPAYGQQSTNNVSSTTPGQNEAVAHEIKQQKAQLLKQREDYVRKVLVLRRELDLLRNQKQDLMSGTSPPPRDLDSIIRENDKLQDEIQSKMKAITNVIEMLSSIIKDGLQLTDLELQLHDDSPKKTKTSKSPILQLAETNTQFNYVHYDPELHWCRMCDKFPQTAKEFLQHLQCRKHLDNIHDNDVGDNTPWHKLPAEPEMPHYEGGQKKRIPIKGLQFFISAPSWYCKLCDVWIGDLHCASQHLKSQVHFQNYQNFVEQNPHWEMEWLKDREKALSRSGKQDSSDSDETTASKKKKKRKERRSAESSKEKKKKKHSRKRKKHTSDSSSSSSSSDSSSDENALGDKSKSIRVAMRNVKVESIMNEDLTEKWEMLGRIVEEHKKKEKEIKKVPEPPKDVLISQWMTVSEPQEKDKYLLDSLKDRMKQKQNVEKAKYAEVEKKRKEREIKEREEAERRQEEEKEAFEKLEKDRKERERLEYERIIDKDRDQVKFKQSLREKYYRRRHTPSPSPERKRSISPEQPTYNRRSSPPSRYRKHSRENGQVAPKIRSRSRSPDRRHEKSDSHSQNTKRKPPGPPSYKKLPFIGRMPLFKHRKPDDIKNEKELKKEEYDKPRLTRFQPGHLARSFIPEPEVVCFPRLSSYPELTLPPTPPVAVEPPPPPPKITHIPKPPPPPKRIEPDSNVQNFKNEDFDPNLYEDPSEMLKSCYSGMDYGGMYNQLYEYDDSSIAKNSEDAVPMSHMMPLQPPPMPPGEDDLAMLGISADDMAAQRF